MNTSIHDRIVALSTNQKVSRLVHAIYTRLLKKNMQDIIPPAFVFTSVGENMVMKFLDEETYPLIMTVSNAVCTMDGTLISDLHNTHITQQELLTNRGEDVTTNAHFYPEVLSAKVVMPEEDWLIAVCDVVLLACYYDLLTK